MRKSKLVDGQGVQFSEYHLWLPSQLCHWPTPPRVTKDSGQQMEFKRQFTECWLCGVSRFKYKRVPPILELHHLAAGTVGRSHERYLFISLCRSCHQERVGVDFLPHLLWAKWRFDQEGTDWVRTAIRIGKFLPTPEPYGEYPDED